MSDPDASDEVYPPFWLQTLQHLRYSVSVHCQRNAQLITKQGRKPCKEDQDNETRNALCESKQSYGRFCVFSDLKPGYNTSGLSLDLEPARWEVAIAHPLTVVHAVSRRTKLNPLSQWLSWSTDPSRHSPQYYRFGTHLLNHNDVEATFTSRSRVLVSDVVVTLISTHRAYSMSASASRSRASSSSQAKNRGKKESVLVQVNHYCLFFFLCYWYGKSRLCVYRLPWKLGRLSWRTRDTAACLESSHRATC